MSNSIRELQEKDIPKVLSLFAKLSEEMAEVSFTEIATHEQVLEWLSNPNTFVFVAADDDVILAVIRARKGKGHQDHSANITVAVDYSFRGNNVAQNLTNFCTQELKKQGVKIVRAEIYSNNLPSINTVLSCGFSFAGTVLMHHYDENQKTYVDDLMFHKILI